MNIAKWRESVIDIKDIPFKNISNIEIISYPYAGNDVFECNCLYNGIKTVVFIKVERNNYSNIENEFNILSIINDYITESPKVLDYGVINNMHFIVTKKLIGDKLSNILSDEKSALESMKYMKAYGIKLSYIHSLKIDTKKATQRKINDIPLNDKNDDFLNKIISWLESNKPKIVFDTFIHGDFHYANILWDNYKITGIIDYEYSGIGFKEQDIAWSIILRPSQKFMKTKKEIKEFLKGYLINGKYDSNKLNWCLVNGYAHFYKMEKDKSSKYALYLKKSILEILNIDNDK